MALSKPSQMFYNLAAAYFDQLYTHPLRTKALTSCVIAALGNYVSQHIVGVKKISEDSILAFGLFGLLFGGPLPHYFYQYVFKLVKNPYGVLLIERLIYTPCFQALSLYLLSRFEGKTHAAASEQLKKLYLPVLAANLEIITLLQYINIKFVPPMLRVLVSNLIGFFWVIYLAKKRARAATAKDCPEKKKPGIDRR
ncbi:PXMP2/4 family protein 3 [Prorops nasuta]|uniref:PXMP2/4 family protein 3 n=1 Tax=Prorops nasuta TaxID=863751 RepID=UPI0034CFA1D7